MKSYTFILILPLAACAPHLDPCLRPEPCDPRIEVCQCVDDSEGPQRAAEAPQGPSDGGGVVDMPDDDNGHGSASGGSADSNGDNSDE